MRAPQPGPAPQAKVLPAGLPEHDHAAFQRSSPQHQHPGLDSRPYWNIPAPVGSGKPAEPPSVQPRRRVSSDQIYAAHREARSEARQALKDEAQTEGLLKSRKAVLPSEVRRRERSVEDPHRGRHGDADQHAYSPEHRRRSSGEEARVQERPRERGRDRTVQRIREGRKEVLSSREGPQTGSLHHSQLQNVLHVPPEQQHTETPTHHQQQAHRPEPQQQVPSAGSPRVYPQKSSSVEMSGPKPKTRARSLSDIGVRPPPAMYHLERASRESLRGSHPPGVLNGDVGTLDTRVSVAQLRHSYLENANRKLDV